MSLKITFIVTLMQLFSSVISKRIPPNSCPDVFKYYKTTNGVIYGQVTVPYDREFKLVFSVNCSYADYLNKPESSIELITIPDSHTQPTHLRYNILFDNNIVIPKITEVKYNDKIYCSGPPEPSARCVQYFKVQIVKTEDLLFVFGTKDISRWATNGATTRGAKRVQTHPEFDFNSAHGDVSIISLDRPLVFTNNISPICLWNGPNDLKDIVTMRGKAAGWGIDDNSNDGQLSVPVARFVEMPVVSQEDCLYSNFSFGTLTSDMTFCAGDRNKKGPCIGDSGAGFMLKKKEKYYLRGIVSLTLGDSNAKCDLENYTVFCDIAKCIDWIQKAMAN